ncbi:succinyl-diaminopimelate desuccinylase [Botrimarina colliarenosi]|uniref:Succinyl-diaminopimelate desuccinylase n=1 Tax=Botrimarina colliarenosi TaxID=2528001 RepID=A0A5C6AM66_9BACT|nr:M28 family peptidase [Botrimarina colliarenosi]TWU00511.1 succinyl-diaminopimelate desuccinylase [Botrimarina colliarenosi]
MNSSTLPTLFAIFVAGPLAAFSQEAPANPVEGDRAMGYLRAICDIGPRVSGSPGMLAQQKLITEHFAGLGVEVEEQRFRAPHPQNRAKRVPMVNLVVRWRPEATRRVLLCGHYDTRPFADQDPDPQARRTGTFVGANDGGSGTALLMELGHLMKDQFDDATDDPDFGVDFAFFDAEEFVFDDRDTYFLGSQWFGTQYAKRGPLPAVDGGKPREWSYEAAVLFDMVADKDLQIYWEGHSFASRQSRPIAREVWDVAERLGVEEFVPQVRHTVLDDHLALRKYGGIRAIDLIDFDYPYWHTLGDTPDKCSGASMAKVGWVTWEWLLERSKDRSL